MSNVVSFLEFKILDIFDNPIQPRGLAEKNVWSLRRRKICVAHKKGISLKGFACKNVFSAARRVVPVEDGGMGLFNIEEFLMAQQCHWVFRSFKSCRDNWRNDLYELSLSNPLSFSPLIIDSRRHPILCDIAVSYERFRNKFNKKMKTI